MSDHQDHTIPDGAWKFDKAVTDVFDEMLARSIPGLGMLRWATHEIGRQFLDEDWSPVYDLGASRGEAVDFFIKNYPRHTYKLIEVSEPMRDVLVSRYEDNRDVKVFANDLRYDRSVLSADASSPLILSVLTLMFVPMEYRQAVVDAVYNTLRPGGAFILVEKQVGNSHHTNSLLNEAYYKMKADNGYSEEEITRKKLSLEGVLTPLTTQANLDMLRSAGFSKIEPFFRCLQFAGYVAVK